jgi:pimeloyl-ACP methyl ester carboxylesterase
LSSIETFAGSSSTTRRDGPPAVVLGDGVAAQLRPAAGEKVFWIHGYSMDSTIWGELWDLLPSWYHIGIDLPGHGASRPIRATDDLRSLALRLGEIALQESARHIAALSFGTMVALQMAIEYPDAFASVTLGAPALAGGPQDPDAAARYGELVRLYRQRGAGPEMAELWMRSPPDIFKGVESRPELRERLFAVISRHAWRELEDGSMLLLTRPAQERRRLHAVRAATLLVLGVRELPAFKACAELMLASIPACERVELASAGHLCLLERPRESARVVDAHLRAAGAAPA